jgi:hypothetical protein
MTAFGGEVKPSVPCLKIFSMLKNLMSMKVILCRQSLMAISHQVSPASLLDVSADNHQRALVDETEIIRAQIGIHNRLEMVTVQGLPCVLTP